MTDARPTSTDVTARPGVTAPGTWAMYAFAVVGWELVVVLLEQVLPHGVRDSPALEVLHPFVTALGWLLGAWFVARRSAVHADAGPGTRRGALVSLVLVAAVVGVRWAVEGAPLVATVAAATDDHDGLVAGLVVATQGLYYLAEALPVALLVLLGDRWGRTRWPGRTHAPWGGLVAAGTWGAVHLLLQGVSGGLYAMTVALVLGTAHVLTGRRWWRTTTVAAVLMLT